MTTPDEDLCIASHAAKYGLDVSDFRDEGGGKFRHSVVSVHSPQAGESVHVIGLVSVGRTANATSVECTRADQIAFLARASGQTAGDVDTLLDGAYTGAQSLSGGTITNATEANRRLAAVGAYVLGLLGCTEADDEVTMTTAPAL